MDGTSLTPELEKLEALRRVLPEAFSEGKIDWEKLTATQEIIDNVIASKPNKVIALDKLFKGNDQLKTNTVLQMRDAGIEFKTI